MAKKIKQRSNLSREEREEERKRQEEEKSRAAAGIDDEFQAKGFELAEWAQSNSHIVMALIGVVVLAGAVTFGVQYMEEASGTEASKLFDEAHQAFQGSLGDAPAFPGTEESEKPSFKDEKERATKARELFQRVTTEHSGSGAAELAHLYVGHTSITLEDYDAAIGAYEKFLDSTKPSDALRFLALDGLAIALEAKGDKQGAAKRLDELVSLPGKLNEDVALLRLARLYRDLGDADKARSTAERLVAEFPDSPLKPDAEELIAGTKSRAEAG